MSPQRQRQLLVLMDTRSAVMRAIALGALRAATARSGWTARLLPLEVNEGERDVVRKTIELPDAILACTCTREQQMALAALRIPVCDLGWPDHAPRPTLGFDEEAIGRYAARHLRRAGYRPSAVALPPDGWAASRARGFADAAGGTVDRLILEASRTATQTAMKTRRLEAWIAALPPRSGIFCVDDQLALRIAAAARTVHRDLPEDLGLCGVGDDPLVLAASALPLTSVRLPGEELGATAVAVLLDGRRNAKLLAPVGVAERGSTAGPGCADPVVAAAVRDIAANPKAPGGIAALAHRLGVGRRRLERRFHAALGRSPQSELTRLRVVAAKQRLALGEDISETARAVGYGSRQSLARAFRSCGETTPAAWRPGVAS